MAAFTLTDAAGAGTGAGAGAFAVGALIIRSADIGFTLC